MRVRRWAARLRASFGLLFGVLMIAACSSVTQAQPTPRPPTATATPRSTVLPTVVTQVPIGSEGRAYHVALVAPDANASGSELAAFLNKRLDISFQVDLLPTYADVLRQLCSDKPTFAWLDGRALLAAQAQGCGTAVFKFGQGTDKSTGVKADVIIRSGIKDAVTAINGFRGKDFCRVNSQDVQGWILPSLAMRAAGLNPAQDLRGIKEFADTAAELQAVADGICVGVGIPAGTLNSYNIRPSSGQLSVLMTTPEFPYGGLVVSSTIPLTVASDVTDLFSKNQDQLRGLIRADDLIKVSSGDFADFQKLAQSAGLNLKALGQ